MTKTAKIVEMTPMFYPTDKSIGAAFRAGATPETAAALLSAVIGNFAGFVGCKPVKIIELLDVSAVKGKVPAAKAAAPAATKTVHSNPDAYQPGETVNAMWEGTKWKCVIDSINGKKVNVTWDSDGSTGEVKIADLSRIGKAKAAAAPAPVEATPAHNLKIGQKVSTHYKVKGDDTLHKANAIITGLDEETGKASLTWVEGGAKISRKFEDCKSVGGRPKADQENAAA